ncbi:unnamed protein product [Lactuca saligna]|uniref:F-box domain-containing protein n=1 Tax=Lactuca saligna TaxID=75948 RepID=A0AA35VI51_LACSI|nr:unnamed protein product [Lactuca saligna]
MENLPGDVLSKIFIRLLAKQLAQMRCVCKTWNAILSESSFIKSHLHHSIHNNDEILFFFKKNTIIFNCFSSPGPITARPSSSPRLELTNFIKLKFPINPQHKNPSVTVIIGSMNGLICFSYSSNHDYFICIWNPSLSASLTLPPSSLPYTRYFLAFGYDPKTDDYKVVKLENIPYYEKPNINMVTQPLGEVYSMRKGSWKLIPQTIPSYIKLFIGQNEVCLNGHLHWLCLTDLEVSPRPQTILTFELGAMTYGQIPLPDSVQLDQHLFRVNTLGVLGGKLCLMSSAKDGEFGVWVMDDDESWAKHHVFSQFSSCITPYGFTSHKEFLFQVGVTCRFALYDPVAAKTKIFKIKMRPPVVDRLIIFRYVDSLVWIAPNSRLKLAA